MSNQNSASSEQRSRSNNNEESNPSSSKRSKQESINAVANPDQGRQMMEERLRSVISHPLCLPLLCVMYDQEELFPAANDDAEEVRQEAKRSIRQRNLEKLQDLPFSDWLTDPDQPINEPAKQSYQTVLQLAIQHAEVEALRRNAGKETSPTLYEKSITRKIEDHCNKIAGEIGSPNIFAKTDKHVGIDNEGAIDIVLTDEPITKESLERGFTPLMIMEFGGKSGNFWQKLHQCVMYLDLLGQAENKLRFDRPVLMSIVTVDYYNANAGTGDDAAAAAATAVRHGTGTSGVTTAVSNAADTGGNTTTAVRHPDGTGGGEAAAGGDTTTTGIHGNVIVKMGLFFCLPPQKPKTENENVNEKPKKSRIVLLWNAVSNDLPDASKKFGKILEVTAYFQKWVSDQPDYAAAFGYQYFSSNCCKMGNRVSVQKTSGAC
jgi:hypothetical protein